MEKFEALILLRNLVSRIETFDDNRKRLEGKITEQELSAIEYAATLLGGVAGEDVSDVEVKKIPPKPANEADDKVVELVTPGPKKESQELQSAREIDLSSNGPKDLPDNMRMCMDFGTAMSKATFVIDDEDLEELFVLNLGVPGDNEEDGQTMLVSSVYVSNEGRLWFGKKAVEYSLTEGDTRLRMDNIKRWLSEDQMNIEVEKKFNPTSIPIQYKDIILAYLTFFTWAVNRAMENDVALSDIDISTMPRRFAMPCLPEGQSREVSGKIKRYLEEAQVLVDTFGDDIHNGLSLEEFVDTVNVLRKQKLQCCFVGEDITEPLGVAGSLVSWKNPLDMCALVVDVGAGTSDFSMFQIHIDSDFTKTPIACEIKGASRGVTQAGNHLDSALKHFILKKAGVTFKDRLWEQINWDIDKSVRQLKETLFIEGEVFVALRGDHEVTVVLKEFLEIEPVKKFGDELRETMRAMLSEIDPSWIERILANASRYITIVFTGGGSSLPMVRSLADELIEVRGRQLPIRPALSFPRWLEVDYPDLEDVYPRIAVSLGGARHRLLSMQGPASMIAGDISSPATLGGYYMKGN